MQWMSYCSTATETKSIKAIPISIYLNVHALKDFLRQKEADGGDCACLVLAGPLYRAK